MGKQPSAKKNHEPFDVLKDKIRKRLLKYTRKAFRMLPKIDKLKGHLGGSLLKAIVSKNLAKIELKYENQGLLSKRVLTQL